jgi:hypothetical protein
MYYILYNEQQWYKAMVVGTRLYLYYYHWVDILSFLCCVFMFCLSSSCVLCAQCYQCLWIVCLRPVSCVPNVTSVSGLFVLRPVSCVPNATSVSGLSIPECPFGFH